MKGIYVALCMVLHLEMEYVHACIRFMCLFIIDTNILCLFYALMSIRLTYFIEHRTMSQWFENGVYYIKLKKTKLHIFT